MPDKIIINPFPGKSEVIFSLKIFPFDDLLPIGNLLYRFNILTT